MYYTHFILIISDKNQPIIDWPIIKSLVVMRVLEFRFLCGFQSNLGLITQDCVCECLRLSNQNCISVLISFY